MENNIEKRLGAEERRSVTLTIEQWVHINYCLGYEAGSEHRDQEHSKSIAYEITSQIFTPIPEREKEV